MRMSEGCQRKVEGRRRHRRGCLCAELGKHTTVVWQAKKLLSIQLAFDESSSRDFSTCSLSPSTRQWEMREPLGGSTVTAGCLDDGMGSGDTDAAVPMGPTGGESLHLDS